MTEMTETPEIPEKEPLYEFDVVEPKSFYTKPTFDKREKISYLITQIFVIILIAESIILTFLDDDNISRFIWLFIPAIYIFHLVRRFLIVPKKWQKNYEKIHAENEDMYSYKFYDDHVEVKTPSLSANFKYELAEGVVETKDILILYFTLKRCFMIDKNQCSEEQLDFIRSIVPEEKQRKSNRKKLPKFILKVVYLTVVSVFLGYMIVCYNYIRNNTYYLKYRCTTYQSFLDCLEHGTIEDVLIIKDKYVEYTYTGKGKHERYYTVSDDTDTLIDLLEEGDVSWKTKRAVYCK